MESSTCQASKGGVGVTTSADSFTQTGDKCTALRQDDRDLLLTEGAGSQQHGQPQGGDEAKAHFLSGPADAFFASVE